MNQNADVHHLVSILKNANHFTKMLQFWQTQRQISTLVSEENEGKLAQFDLHVNVITDTLAQLRTRFTESQITSKKDMEAFRAPIQAELGNQ